MDVVKHDRQGRLGSRGAERILQMVHHPVARVGVADTTQGLGVTDGWPCPQCGREQRRERHSLLVFEALAEQRPNTGCVGLQSECGEQFGLADAWGTLNDDDTADTVDEGGNVLAGGCQFGVSATDRRDHGVGRSAPLGAGDLGRNSRSGQRRWLTLLIGPDHPHIRRR